MSQTDRCGTFNNGCEGKHVFEGTQCLYHLMTGIPKRITPIDHHYKQWKVSCGSLWFYFNSQTFPHLSTAITFQCKVYRPSLYPQPREARTFNWALFMSLELFCSEKPIYAQMSTTSANQITFFWSSRAHNTHTTFTQHSPYLVAALNLYKENLDASFNE